MTDSELIAEVVAWIERRNALSSDCISVGIRSDDIEAWTAELCRREEPLRRAAEKYVWEREPKQVNT